VGPRLKSPKRLAKVLRITPEKIIDEFREHSLTIGFEKVTGSETRQGNGKRKKKSQEMRTGYPFYSRGAAQETWDQRGKQKNRKEEKQGNRKLVLISLGTYILGRDYPGKREEKK